MRIKGADELEKHLKGLQDMSPIENVVSDNAKELEKTMKKNANFSGGYDTGETKSSIKGEVNGMEGSVAPTTEWAIYLEYGTRDMSAQPFIRPSLEEQAKKFKKDMDDLV